MYQETNWLLANKRHKRQPARFRLKVQLLVRNWTLNTELWKLLTEVHQIILGRNLKLILTSGAASIDVEIYAGKNKHSHQFVVEFMQKHVFDGNKSRKHWSCSFALAIGSCTPGAISTCSLDGKSCMASHCADQFVANKKKTNFTWMAKERKSGSLSGRCLCP